MKGIMVKKNRVQQLAVVALTLLMVVSAGWYLPKGAVEMKAGVSRVVITNEEPLLMVNGVIRIVASVVE